MQKPLQSSHREPTRHKDVRLVGQVGRTYRDGSLNAWMQPHQTDATKPLFHGNTNQRKAETVERMGRISDLDCADGECG